MENTNIQSEGRTLVLDLHSLILQRWDLAIQKVGQYYKLRQLGTKPNTHELKSAIYELFLTIRQAYLKDQGQADYLEFEKTFLSKEIEPYLLAFSKLDKWLYIKKVTYFDTKVVYDRTIAETANIFNGL